jgi:hypothetical protein
MKIAREFGSAQDKIIGLEKSIATYEEKSNQLKK